MGLESFTLKGACKGGLLRVKNHSAGTGVAGRLLMKHVRERVSG